ncbi:dTDP-4-dehydrorhamnose reductase [Desulfurobacterium atlanticum]|uniref:dTDP-4-dehydrorhamnose reductase n=1 Tax=Desulfurobacterium atlanticum TaxID=240169 RepID=A0A238XLY1_9BACT|nr:dTDP-4-dehydrorhamnose reductase [Desulfurobacterium atlanticum]
MIVITGGKGQLGREFIKALNRAEVPYKAFDKSELDISSGEKVLSVIRDIKPDVIINCAAYNQVDRAETEYEMAYKVNVIGVENLAVAAKEVGAFFVHYSSDYVFDGKKEDGLYTEKDTPSPLNEYGKSKLLGEERVKAVLDNYLILRVSWVYGEGKQNFIHKLLSWAERDSYLKVACDEFSVPTYTGVIVDVTLKAIEQGLSGLYHLTNSGFTSRFEWARAVFEILGVDKFIRPVPSSVFSLPAKRPLFSPMSNKKISKELSVSIPYWEESLREFLGCLKG